MAATSETPLKDNKDNEAEELYAKAAAEATTTPEEEDSNKMSEEVAKDPPAEILPAKSEDKLEIEKEEAAEKKEEKTEAESGEDKKPSETEEEAKDGGDKKEEAAEDTAEAGGEEKKKGFKMPNVILKLPKVPGVLRSLSKDRNKVSTTLASIIGHWPVKRIHPLNNPIVC